MATFRDKHDITSQDEAEEDEEEEDCPGEEGGESSDVHLSDLSSTGEAAAFRWHSVENL